MMFLRPPRLLGPADDAQLRKALVALADLLKGAKPTEIPGFVRVPVVHNERGDHVHVHVPHPRFPGGHPQAGEPMPRPDDQDHAGRAEFHAAALHQAETAPLHPGRANAVMRVIRPGQPHRYVGVMLPNPGATDIANYSGATGKRDETKHKLAAFHPADAHTDTPGVHFHAVDPEDQPDAELPDAAYHRSVSRRTIYSQPHTWTPEGGFQGDAAKPAKPYATFRTVEKESGGREHPVRYVTPWLPRIREGAGDEAPPRKPGELRLSAGELHHLRTIPPLEGEAKTPDGTPFARWALEQLPARDDEPGHFRYHARATLHPGTYTEGQLKRQHEYEWELEGDASARARALRRLDDYLKGHAERLSHLKEKASRPEPARLADTRTIDELRGQHGRASDLLVDPQARAKIGDVIETRRRGGHSKQTLAHRRLAVEPKAMEKLALDWEAENQPQIEKLTQHLSRRYRFLSDDQVAEAVRSGVRDAIHRFDPAKGALGSFVRAHAEGRAGGLAQGAERSRQAAFAHYEDRGEDVKAPTLGRVRSPAAPTTDGPAYDDLMDRVAGHPQEYARVRTHRLGLDPESVELLTAANPTGDPAHGVDHAALARKWATLGRGQLPEHVLETVSRAQQQIWQHPGFREYHDTHVAPLQRLRDEAWQRQSGNDTEKSLARLFTATCRAVNDELWRRDFRSRRATRT